MEKISGEILEKFSGLPYVGDVASRILYNEGFRSIKEMAEVDPEELAKVLGIEKEKASEIVEGAVQMSKEGEGTAVAQETASDSRRSCLRPGGPDGGGRREDSRALGREWI